MTDDDEKPQGQLDSTGSPAPNRTGMLKDMYSISDDIDTPFAKDIEAMFYPNDDLPPAEEETP
ncbi:hypothetical protein ACYPKM_05030 [Pseudomonas aeruginosa]